ncbi:MAG: hypothetical protein GQ477_04595 [Nanohaloarchaea archaeon]|nr:hypothetical protein [Candidatus Nanohaloarchaea archaeon]
MIVTIGNPSVDTVTLDSNTRVHPGGASVYSAISASALTQAAIVGKIGKDYPKDFLDIFKDKGIDLKNLKIIDHVSKNFEIMIDENFEAKYPKYNVDIDKKLTARAISSHLLNQDTSFLITQMTPKKQLAFIKKIRQTSPMSLILVNTHYPYIDRHKGQFNRLIDSADIFVANEIEAQKLTDTNRTDIATHILSKKYPKTIIIVTLGSLGSIVIKGKTIQFAPTIYNTMIKDPTGSGDTFSGAFLASYHKIRDPVRSAIVGNTMASLKSAGRGYDNILNLKFKKVDDLWNFVLAKSHNFGAQKILSEF